MAVPTVPSFYLGLCLIVVGTGLLKPNVSAMVGDLYPEGGARRDAGFSVFYSGINLGAFLGPLVCGYLGEGINWHLGFGAAGVGMVFGLIQYWRGGRYLGTAGFRKTEGERSGAVVRASRGLLIGVGAIAAVVLLLFLLDSAGVVNLTLQGIARATGVVIVALALAYFASVLFFGGLSTPEKKRVIVIFLFFVSAAIFWSGFEQAGSSMNLFAERLTNRIFFGWEMPASWLQSVNSMFIIMLAPVFGWIWLRLGSRAPSTPAKFGYGLVFLAIGFLVMVWAALRTQGAAVKVGAHWLVATYFLHTVGELCLSPVGLSSVTKLSPPRLVGQMMGTWFMGSALGNLIAGLVAGGSESMPLPELFGFVAKVTGVAGILLLVLAKPIRRLMGTLPGGETVPAVEPKTATPAVSS
jgi:POT family proton-dependent oligopeptide transporter